MHTTMTSKLITDFIKTQKDLLPTYRWDISVLTRFRKKHLSPIPSTTIVIQQSLVCSFVHWATSELLELRNSKHFTLFSFCWFSNTTYLFINSDHLRMDSMSLLPMLHTRYNSNHFLPLMGTLASFPFV